MRRSNKHQAQKVNLFPLNGGINVTQAPEQIAENEMQECQNFIYDRDSARLVGRGGLEKIAQFDYEVNGMHYDIDTNTIFAFLSNRDCWQLVISSGAPQMHNLDKLSGTKPPRCERFKDKMFFASGDHLQYFDFSSNSTLQMVTTSPLCDRLFYRFGRLAVTMAGGDRITYSSTGDATSELAWKENTNDDSSCKWLDIGSDDAGDIMEVVPLATDMIIFKSNGKAYQFVGDADFNSWAVYNVANFTDLTADFSAGICATNIGNEVVFLSLRGLKTLSTTQDYGNVAATDIGAKFNKLITDKMYEPEMINMRRHRMILIRPTADKSFFVAYNYGLNAATTLKFAFPITAIVETKDDVFVASGNSIYRWTITATQDDTTDIEYVVKPRAIISSDKILVKAIDTKFSSDHAGNAALTIGRLKVDMPTNARRKVLCNHSTDYVDIDVKSSSRFELDHIVLDIANL